MRKKVLAKSRRGESCNWGRRSTFFVTPLRTEYGMVSILWCGRLGRLARVGRVQLRRYVLESRQTPFTLQNVGPSLRSYVVHYMFRLFFFSLFRAAGRASLITRLACTSQLYSLSFEQLIELSCARGMTAFSLYLYPARGDSPLRFFECNFQN